MSASSTTSCTTIHECFPQSPLRCPTPFSENAFLQRRAQFDALYERVRKGNAGEAVIKEMMMKATDLNTMIAFQPLFDDPNDPILRKVREVFMPATHA